MMDIKDLSELHVLNIPRVDKGRWVEASRAANSKLTAWVIATLNDAAEEQLKSAPDKEQGVIE
jgi:hypothetical protein